MGKRFRYNHRQLLPREADLGYAFDLSRDARAYIKQLNGEYIVLRKGRRIHATNDVRELVRMLKALLASDEAVHQ